MGRSQVRLSPGARPAGASALMGALRLRGGPSHPGALKQQQLLLGDQGMAAVARPPMSQGRHEDVNPQDSRIQDDRC